MLRSSRALRSGTCKGSYGIDRPQKAGFSGFVLLGLASLSISPNRENLRRPVPRGSAAGLSRLPIRGNDSPNSDGPNRSPCHSSHALPPACSQPETKQDADAARCCMGKGRPAPSSEGVAVLVCACQDLLGPGHRQRYRATARPSACRGARRHAACRDLLRLVDLGRKEGRPAAVGVIENHEFAVDFGDVFLFR